MRGWRKRELQKRHQNLTADKADSSEEDEEARQRRLVKILTPTFLSNIRRGIILNDRELQTLMRKKGSLMKLEKQLSVPKLNFNKVITRGR